MNITVWKKAQVRQGPLEILPDDDAFDVGREAQLGREEERGDILRRMDRIVANRKDADDKNNLDRLLSKSSCIPRAIFRKL